MAWSSLTRVGRVTFTIVVSRLMTRAANRSDSRISGFLFILALLTQSLGKSKGYSGFQKSMPYTGAMKSYNQSCPIARALDVIGDRWSLLVLRELLIQGPCRYTDLANGLPGIATSVLADRLRSLEESGLIRREAAPPPIATTLFHLTEAGRAVNLLVTLGRWGVEHLDGPGPDAEVQFHWFPFALRCTYADMRPRVYRLRSNWKHRSARAWSKSASRGYIMVSERPHHLTSRSGYA